jgi:putative flippase GtrA
VKAEMPVSRAATRVLCFGLVGGTATAVYAVFTWVAVTLLGWPAPVGSLASYALAASLSYAGHRLVTFRDAAPSRRSGTRFTLIAALGYLAALVIPAFVTSLMGTPVEASILATCLAIPLMNYVALSRLVFAGGPEHAQA